MSKLYDLMAPIYGRVVPGLYERATARAAERLSAGAPATILEVGVGPGHLLKALKKKSNAGQIVGIDISKGMLKQSRRMLAKNGTSATLVRGDAVVMPFRTGTFDGVVTAFLLDLFPKPSIAGALGEMARVLAPGGRIVVASMQFSSPLLKQAWMLAYNVAPDVVGRLRPAEYQEHVETTGLRILQDEEIPEAAGTRLQTLVKVVG